MLSGDTTYLGPCPARSWCYQPRHIGAVWWHYNAWSHVLIEMQQSIVVVKDLWLYGQGRTSPPCRYAAVHQCWPRLDSQGRTSPQCMSRCSSPSTWPRTLTGWPGEDLTSMQQSIMVDPDLWLDGPHLFACRDAAVNHGWTRPLNGWTGKELNSKQQSIMVEPDLWLNGQGRTSTLCMLNDWSEWREVYDQYNRSKKSDYDLTWAAKYSCKIRYNDDDWVCPRLCDLLYFFTFRNE